MSALEDCTLPGNALCLPTLTSTELVGVFLLLSLISVYLLRQFRLPKADEAWTVVMDGKVQYAPLPAEAAVVARLWCGALLIGAISLLLTGARMSIPMQLIICSMVSSGLLISIPFFQSIFHISSMCSWFAVFDLLIYAEEDERVLNLLFSPKGIFVGFLTSVAIIRLQIGNKWQFRDPSHLLIGLVLILGYFWVVDLPSCSIYSVETLCTYFGKTSNGYLHNGSSERIMEVFKMVCAHFLFSLALYLNAADVTWVEDRDAATTVNEEESKSNESPSSDENGLRRFSGATDTEDDNQTITDDDGQQRKLPEDCVEISEAEAIAIIQNGLNSFKKKRAT